MNTMAPIRPTELHACRVRLTTEPTSVAEARRQVRMAICAWHVPVDPDVAVLLTSDLVTNAIRHEAGDTVTLAISSSGGELRVDVHGSWRSRPSQADARVDAEIGPGLILVATLSDEWGSYRTPTARPCTSRSRSTQTSETPAWSARTSPYTCTHVSGHAGQVPGSEPPRAGVAAPALALAAGASCF